jgi:hypothetical protein
MSNWLNGRWCPSRPLPPQESAAPSRLVDYQLPPMPVAAVLQSETPPAATLRRSVQLSTYHGGLRSWRDSGTSRHHRTSKPYIVATQAQRRPGHLAHAALAQSRKVSPHSATIAQTRSRLPISEPVPTPPSHLAAMTRHPDICSYGTDDVHSFPRNMQFPFLQILESAEKNLNLYSRIHDQELNRNDKGRIILLQEAMQTNDILYLILSQVFCLYTLRDVYIVGWLNDVPQSSWLCLEELLGPNDKLTLSGINFLAEFPIRVEEIFHRGWGQSFLDQLVIVKRLLRELSRRWDKMSSASNRRRAPPLTQEMVEESYMISPVIQTTAFRVIARSFWWGWDDPGLRFLEILHKIDQHTYICQKWRRAEGERAAACGAFKYVYDVWQHYRLRPEASREKFVLQDARAFFETRPTSMQQPTNFGIDGSSYQLSQGAARATAIERHGGSRLTGSRDSNEGGTAVGRDR